MEEIKGEKMNCKVPLKQIKIACRGEAGNKINKNRIGFESNNSHRKDSVDVATILNHFVRKHTSNTTQLQNFVLHSTKNYFKIVFRAS